MMRGFNIIYEYLGVLPSPNTFFFLLIFLRPTGGELTTGWLSFQARSNRKVFNLYEESFYHFKPIYFKVFGDPGTTSLWENKEGEF